MKKVLVLFMYFAFGIFGFGTCKAAGRGDQVDNMIAKTLKTMEAVVLNLEKNAKNNKDYLLEKNLIQPMQDMIKEIGNIQWYHNYNKRELAEIGMKPEVEKVKQEEQRKTELEVQQAQHKYRQLEEERRMELAIKQKELFNQLEEEHVKNMVKVNAESAIQIELAKLKDSTLQEQREKQETRLDNRREAGRIHSEKLQKAQFQHEEAMQKKQLEDKKQEREHILQTHKDKLKAETEKELELNKQNLEFQEKELKRTQDQRMENELKTNQFAIKKKWDFFKDPKMVGLYASAIATLVIIAFAAKHGFPVLQKWIEKKLFKPVLVIETSDNPRSRAKMKGFTLKRLVLPEVAKDEFNDLVSSTQSAIKLGVPFQHTLFFGPPGTGKTLAAKTIANLSGMNYDIIAGSSFDQFSEEEALQELQHIFAWAKKARKGQKGRIIFIDEADSLLKRRDGSDMRGTKLVNMFLSYLPEPEDPDLMFIFATNHPERLDPAIRSRIMHSFEFHLPSQANREAMLILKFNTLLRKYKIAPEVTDALPQIAEMMDGFSGRDILSFVLQCRSSALLRKDRMITQDIVDTILLRLITRKKSEMKMDKNQTLYFKSDDTPPEVLAAPAA